MYQISYRKSALKSLAKMPVKFRLQFIDAFTQVANNQETGLDIKKLEGRDGFRLRIGSYRAIYRRLNEMMVIEVINVGSRGDIYK